MVAVPLACLYVLVLRDDAGQPANLTAISFLRGMGGYLCVVPVLLLINRFVPAPAGGYRMLVHAGAVDLLLPTLLGTLLYLWFTPDVPGLPPVERLVSHLSFQAGLFSLAGLLDLVMRADYFGPYELFLLPTLRIVVVLLSSVLLYLYWDETFWVRYLYLATYPLVPFVFGSVFLLESMNLRLAAVAISAAGFFGSLVAVTLGTGLSVRQLRLR